MQSVPGWPADTIDDNLDVTVRVGGVIRDAVSVSISKDLNAVLPAQAAGTGGGAEMSATIVFADGEPVVTRGRHPWSHTAWPPTAGDPVTIDVGRAGVMVRQLTGVIDSASGSFAGRDVSVTVVDLVDRLRKQITVDPMQASMPPLGEIDQASEYTYRHVGLSPTYFTDLSLRRSGYYSTPKRHEKAVFSAPLMGSLWPEVGSVFKASGSTSTNPLFYGTPWGLGAANASADYWPWHNAAGASGKLDQTMQITFMVSPTLPADHTTASVTVKWTAAGHNVRLSVQNGRAIYATAQTDAGFANVCSMPNSQANTARVFTLRVTPAGACTIYADNGASVTGSFTPSSAMTGTASDVVSIVAGGEPNPLISGAQVAYTTDPQWLFTPNANITYATRWQSLEASPFLQNRLALDLLSEQAKAECSGWWLDEYGTFVWRNRDALTSSSPVATVTSERDIFEVTWEANTDSVRSEAVVAYEVANMSISPAYSVDVWQGDGKELEAGETYEEIIASGSGVDWIMVDDTVQELGDPGTGTGDIFNRGYGSWFGATVVKDGDPAEEALRDWSANQFLTKIDSNTYKLRVIVPRLEDPNSIVATERVHLRTPGDGFTTTFWPKRRGFNLPILRAKATTEWSEASVTSSIKGPLDAPVFEHDAGWWIQDAAAVGSLADWLIGQMHTPLPVISGLEIRPDPRLQLGDIVFVQDNAQTGVHLKVLITSISLTVDEDSGSSMSLGCRVLEVANSNVTYAEADEYVQGMTYTAVDDDRRNNTYAQIDATPLT